jgi:plastocyanin
MLTPRVLCLLALLALGPLAAMSSPPVARATPQGEGGVILGVAMEDNAFVPATVITPVGTSVIWHNMGTTRHTATADNEAFDTGSVKPGAQATYTFTTPGTYTYHCAIHPEMVGQIVILGT